MHVFEECRAESEAVWLQIAEISGTLGDAAATLLRRRVDVLDAKMVEAQEQVDDEDLAGLAHIVGVHCPWLIVGDEHLSIEEIALSNLVRGCLAGAPRADLATLAEIAVLHNTGLCSESPHVDLAAIARLVEACLQQGSARI